MALLVLLKGRLLVTGKTKCAICGLAKNFKIFCGVGKKIKHRRVGNACRLTRCPFLVSFLCRWSPVKMVYFFQFLVVCSLVLCRLLRLLVTSL